MQAASSSSPAPTLIKVMRMEEEPNNERPSSDNEDDEEESRPSRTPTPGDGISTSSALMEKDMWNQSMLLPDEFTRPPEKEDDHNNNGEDEDPIVGSESPSKTTLDSKQKNDGTSSSLPTKNISPFSSRRKK